MKRVVVYSLLFLLSMEVHPQSVTGYEACINAASSFLRLDETASAAKWLDRVPASARTWEWNVLKNQTDRSSTSIKLEDAVPTRLALNSEGTLLAFGDSKGKIRILDAKTLTPEKLIFAHSSSVYSVKFSADGKYLASCSRDTTISIWETGSYTEVLRIKTAGRGLADIDFSPDGATILHCSWYMNEGVKGIVTLYDTKTGEVKWRTEHNTHPLVKAEFAPDGRSFGIGSWEWNVAVWNLDSLSAEPRIFDFNDVESYSAVDDFCFSPNGKYLAAATKNNTPRVWEVATGKPVHELKGHHKSVLAIDWSPDGKQIFTAGDEGTVLVWSAETGQPLMKLRGHLDRIGSLAVHPAGSPLYSAASDSSIKLWDIERSLPFSDHKVRNQFVYAFDSDPRGEILVTNGPDSSLTVWEIAGGKPLLNFPALDALVNSTSISPAGSKIAACNWGKTVKVFDSKTGHVLYSPDPMDGGSPKILFSPDGNILSAISTGKSLYLWDGGSGRLVFKLPLAARPFALAFSSDSRLVATGDVSGNVEIFQVSDGTKIASLQASNLPVHSIAFERGNRTIITGGDDRVARIWDIGTMNLIREFKGHAQRIYSLITAAGSTRLITGSSDQTVKIWDLSTGEELMTLSDFSNPVYNIILLPNDRGILVNSSGKEIFHYPATGFK